MFMTASRRIHTERSWLDILHRLCDAASIAVGLPLALAVLHAELENRVVAMAAVAVSLHFIMAEVTGLYRSWRGTTTDREIVCVIGTWFGALVGLVVVAWASQSWSSSDLPFDPGTTANWFELPVAVATQWWLVSAALLGVTRMLLRLIMFVLRAHGINTRNFAIVGVNDLAFQLARNVHRAPELGLKLTGLYDDREAHRLPRVPADVAPKLGDIDELVEQAKRGEISIVYIAFPMRAEARIKNVLARLSDTTASVYLVPDFFVFELLHSRWTQIGGLPAVSVFENPFYGVDGLVKRVADFALAAVILLFAALPMTLIAVAIKLTSRGPVFFRQKRYGLDGQVIGVWKFRSMKVCKKPPVTIGIENNAAEKDGTEIVVQATRHDPRVTKLGAILRRTSLDELPQLFNVLDGTMSLVGPRPHANQHNEGYRKIIQGYMLRHKVKPGITGLAQVNGWRGETDTLEKMQKRVEFDHQYIREWSPWLDVKILLKTVVTVLGKQNAY